MGKVYHYCDLNALLSIINNKKHFQFSFQWVLNLG